VDGVFGCRFEFLAPEPRVHSLAGDEAARDARGVIGGVGELGGVEVEVERVAAATANRSGMGIYFTGVGQGPASPGYGNCMTSRAM